MRFEKKTFTQAALTSWALNVSEALHRSPARGSGGMKDRNSPTGQRDGEVAAWRGRGGCLVERNCRGSAKAKCERVGWADRKLSFPNMKQSQQGHATACWNCGGHRGEQSPAQ